MKPERLTFAFAAVFCIYCIGHAAGCILPVHPSANEDRLFGMTSSGMSAIANVRLRREIMDSLSPGQRVTCKANYTGAVPRNRVNTKERLEKLREGMKKAAITAYIVPSDDAHQSEYVHPCDGRREYISGFSGSAGTAVITKDLAALWTDGRYFLQAEEELDCNWILMRTGQPGVPSLVEWLDDVLDEKTDVGADPKLMAASVWLTLKQQLSATSKQLPLKSIPTNLIDEFWTTNRPPCSNATIYPLELAFAGKEWQDKVSEIRMELRDSGRDAMVVSALDEVAWLLNLRGDDIPHTPVFKSYLIMDLNSVFLFVASNKVTAEVREHLNSEGCDKGPNCVQIREYDDFFKDLGVTFFPRPRSQTYNKVLIPSRYSYSGGASYAIYEEVSAHYPVDSVPSPLLFHKAKKNEIEIVNIKQCQVRDSATLIEFLEALESGVTAGDYWDEIKAAQKLAELRTQQANNMGQSFSAISAYGPNGAIIHYEPTEATNVPIGTDNLYLLDSGGQYKDCTTDVTRTLHFGEPSDFQREAYTRVLMGSIDLAMTVFPKGTTDTAIDLAARQHLYQVGLNYRHGTGHGIGMFLGVHEEPGYYEDGKFGIRLETIMTVVEKKLPFNFDGPYLGMEAVTLVPFEPKLICVELLNDAQKTWLNEYNKLTRQKVGPELNNRDNVEAYNWMLARTQDVTEGKPCKLARSSATTTIPYRAGPVAKMLSFSSLGALLALALSAVLI